MLRRVYSQILGLGKAIVILRAAGMADFESRGGFVLGGAVRKTAPRLYHWWANVQWQ